MKRRDFLKLVAQTVPAVALIPRLPDLPGTPEPEPVVCIDFETYDHMNGTPVWAYNESPTGRWRSEPVQYQNLPRLPAVKEAQQMLDQYRAAYPEQSQSMLAALRFDRLPDWMA